jgi:tripartite-type tricarboxylate transporter receptor subunit TctC
VNGAPDEDVSAVNVDRASHALCTPAFRAARNPETLEKTYGCHYPALQPKTARGSKRSPLAPEIPTVVESGINFVATTWYGVLAPAGTPPAIIARLNAASRSLLEDAEVKAQAAPQGVVLTPSTPDEFGTFLRSEVALWAKVVKDTGIKAE